jgi:hypothetical protein
MEASGQLHVRAALLGERNPYTFVAVLAVLCRIRDICANSTWWSQAVMRRTTNHAHGCVTPVTRLSRRVDTCCCTALNTVRTAVSRSEVAWWHTLS